MITIWTFLWTIEYPFEKFLFPRLEPLTVLGESGILEAVWTCRPAVCGLFEKQVAMMMFSRSGPFAFRRRSDLSGHRGILRLFVNFVSLPFRSSYFQLQNWPLDLRNGGMAFVLIFMIWLLSIWQAFFLSILYRTSGLRFDERFENFFALSLSYFVSDIRIAFCNRSGKKTFW